MQQVIIGKDQVSVAELIGKGGEGEVFTIKGRPELAVKVYNANLRSKREGKVRAMVEERLSTQTDLVAYPREIVTDRTGSFLGFVMRLVSGYRPLHELYSPKSRQRHFPKVDYRFLVRTALNVARAVEKVHQAGGVIGDLNHSGILVAQDATVALIDADSFQFRLKGKSYPCVVGVPDFTPPELHGKNLESFERTIAHDNFGLAVAIFHLLFMGRHPYAGRYKGPDISMSEAIAQNRFAFSLSRQNETQTTPPPGTLTLDLFPSVIAHAFEQAFGLIPSSRPNAMTWIDVLTSLETSLNHCNKIKTHYYPSKAKSCVWCRLIGNNSFDMFPDLSAVLPNISTDVHGTEQAIREIMSFRFPATADLLQPLSAPESISNALREAKNGKMGYATLGLLMLGAAVCGFIYVSSIFYVWIGLAIWGYALFTDRKVKPVIFLKNYKDADERVQRELDSFLQRNGLIEVVKVRRDLDIAIITYKGHDASLAHDLMILKSNREARQRKTYLDNFPIRRANISGIGPAKTATLISFGIETAADVNRAAVMQVPGFGKVMTNKIMDWRREKEANFRYDLAPNAQDTADEKTLRGQYAIEKAKLESTIRNGLGTLRNAKIHLDALPNTAKTDNALCNALMARAQAEHDLNELGLSIPISSVTLSVPPSPTVQPSKVPSIPVPNRISKPSLHNATQPKCPICGSLMRQRSGKYGKFWGCSQYPRCKGTRN